MKQIRQILPLVALALLIAENTYAHRVNVFAWVEGDTIFVESKFSGGKKVKGGTIVVTDASGAEMLTGTTNEEGEFSFKPARRTQLKITLKAGMGHQAEWTIPAEDFEPTTPAADTSVRKTNISGESINPETRTQKQASPS